MMPDIHSAECVHLPDYAGETCAGCGEEIDGYGNTENDFKFCSFPDCGCDGERLCMAGSASERASKYNVEGMYVLRDPSPRMQFMGAYYSGEFDAPSDSDRNPKGEDSEAASSQRDDSAGRKASPETQSTGSAGGDQPTSGVVAQ